MRSPSVDVLIIGGYILLGLFVVVLLAFLASAIWQAERAVRESPAEAAADPDASIAIEVPPALVRTAEQQLAAMHEGTPRNAIVACWWQLERSCAASGFPRAAAETSTEFTTRALNHYVLEPEIVDGLAALYREARFSTHDLTESDRNRASAALEDVLASLRSPRPAGASRVVAS